MSANIERSGRGKKLDNYVDGAFAKGFEEARNGQGFSQEYETRSLRWQWTYEAGRQFAAWCKSRDLTIALRRADGRLTATVNKYLPRAFAGGVL